MLEVNGGSALKQPLLSRIRKTETEINGSKHAEDTVAPATHRRSHQYSRRRQSRYPKRETEPERKITTTSSFALREDALREDTKHSLRSVAASELWKLALPVRKARKNGDS